VICPGYVRDAGMFQVSKSGASPPGITATVAPERVVSRTIRAIERNKPEVIVASGLVNIVDVLHALAPRFTTMMARRSGAYDFNKPH
jgi:short-subunit dehydrogenase